MKENAERINQILTPETKNSIHIAAMVTGCSFTSNILLVGFLIANIFLSDEEKLSTRSRFFFATGKTFVSIIPFINAIIFLSFNIDAKRFIQQKFSNNVPLNEIANNNKENATQPNV